MSLKLGGLLVVACSAGTSLGQALDTPFTPVMPIHRQAVEAQPLAPAGGSPMDVTLYDNGPLVTHPGASCAGLDASALQTLLGLNVYGFGWVGALRLADDFVVPAGETWDVTGFEFFAYLTNSTVPSYTLVTIQIWSGRPGDVGSTVLFGDTTTNRLASAATFTNTYRPLDTTVGTECIRRVQRLQCNLTASLPAGTYWISISGGANGFMPPVTLLNATQKPGANGRQLNGTWVDLLDNGTAATIQDIPFLVIGTVGGECYPDCNEDGVLTVQDFGCFQTAFVAGNMYADCNEDGVLTVQDFGCFQTAFVAGCP